MTYSISGTSGAVVTFVDDKVVKTSHDLQVKKRILNQADWLLKHQIPAFPKIYQIEEDGFSMEKLERIDWYRIDANNEWMIVLEKIVQQMSTVWTQPPDYVTDLYQFMDFLRPRLLTYAPNLKSSMDRWFEDLMSISSYTECLIHGDNTLDNTCIRSSTGEVVFIDPNPRAQVPSYMATDIAMICQSTLGYEHFKYRHPLPKWTMEDVKELTSISDNDWFATLFFTAAKFIRILNYETKLQPTFLQVATDLIKKEGYL